MTIVRLLYQVQKRPNGTEWENAKYAGRNFLVQCRPCEFSELLTVIRKVLALDVESFHDIRVVRALVTVRLGETTSSKIPYQFEDGRLRSSEA